MASRPVNKIPQIESRNQHTRVQHVDNQHREDVDMHSQPESRDNTPISNISEAISATQTRSSYRGTARISSRNQPDPNLQISPSPVSSEPTIVAHTSSQTPPRAKRQKKHVTPGVSIISDTNRVKTSSQAHLW